MSTKPPPGSYLKTSSHVDFQANSGGGGALNADCKTVAGGSTPSTLQYDVANMNGVLTPVPGGSYQRTSRDIHLENGDDGAVFLVAECRKIDGTWVGSRLQLPNISNQDGVLTL